MSRVISSCWSGVLLQSLTAAAMVTERIRLGTLLTPLSRMRPWKLASETATLDQLSGGRVILALGRPRTLIVGMAGCSLR